MTAGHRHHTIRLRHDSKLLRVLLITIYTTSDREKAERSPFAYRLGRGMRYRMTLLGPLHRYLGLTVDVKKE